AVAAGRRIDDRGQIVQSSPALAVAGGAGAFVAGAQEKDAGHRRRWRGYGPLLLLADCGPELEIRWRLDRVGGGTDGPRQRRTKRVALAPGLELRRLAGRECSAPRLSGRGRLECGRAENDSG